MAKVQGSSSKVRSRTLTTAKIVKASAAKKPSHIRKLTPAAGTPTGVRQSAAASALSKKTPVVLWDEMGAIRQLGLLRR
ncbi:MAG: hypothetical protein ACKVOI_17935 [Dongiaceae bacterium]